MSRSFWFQLFIDVLNGTTIFPLLYGNLATPHDKLLVSDGILLCWDCIISFPRLPRFYRHFFCYKYVRHEHPSWINWSLAWQDVSRLACQSWIFTRCSIEEADFPRLPRFYRHFFCYKYVRHEHPSWINWSLAWQDVSRLACQSWIFTRCSIEEADFPRLPRFYRHFFCYKYVRHEHPSWINW